MQKSELAEQYFLEGYNCAQSVFLAYAQEFNLEKEFALKISSSFGGGMGRLREVCGTLSAMFAIAGLKKGYTQNNDDEIKEKHYALIQHLANKFKQRHKTIICRELLELNEQISSPKPQARTKEYYEERPCVHFIKTACNIIDEEIFKA